MPRVPPQAFQPFLQGAVLLDVAIHEARRVRSLLDTREVCCLLGVVMARDEVARHGAEEQEVRGVLGPGAHLPGLVIDCVERAEDRVVRLGHDAGILHAEVTLWNVGPPLRSRFVDEGEWRLRPWSWGGPLQVSPGE